MAFNGKVAIVTGGATGIGLGIARVLGEKGAKVVLAQIPSMLAEAERLAANIVGTQAIALGVDIRDPKSVEKMVADTIAHFGQVDILVNNAALAGTFAIGAMLDSKPEQVDDLVDVNLKGTFYCSQAVAKQMVARKQGGNIVHIASVGAYAAQEFGGIYCATKAGVVSLAKSMALEWAPYGIRVNAVAPGDINAGSSANIDHDLKEAGTSGKFERVTPLGRRGKPEEIGDAVAFLVSNESSFITGTTLLVDGGFLAY
jgi:NAD(P)-dependent dehydrogenase (short-subunit alcohol dehydrogenase family)